MNDQDHDLRELFSRLRDEHHQRAPGFDHLWQRARRAAALPGSPAIRSALSWKMAACAAAVAAVAAGWFLVPPSTHPRPSLAKALPVLLDSDPGCAPLFARLTVSPPASGTDFLLPVNLTIDSL